jgi:hypothetical protein
MSSRGLVLALAMVVSACSTMGTVPVMQVARRSANITDLELADAGALDLYSVVQKLRPNWLRMRQMPTQQHRNQIMVYYGMTRMGGPEVLHNIAPGDVARITYLSPGAAQLRFGNGHVNGAILLEPATR